MIIHVDVSRLIELGLTADQYVWLRLVYENLPNTAQRLADSVKPDSLKKYLVSTEPVVINRTALRELFEFKDSYFWEFYTEFPLKVPIKGGGYRALKTQRSDTKLAKDMKKKYEARVKTLEQHNHVMRCLKADIEHRRRSNSMQFLPAIEAYINGQDWEKAEYLLEIANSVQALTSKDSYGEELI